MTTGPANLIKAQILVQLNALKAAGVLGAIIEQDITANVLTLDFPAYPCVVLGSSSVASVWEYQQANKRTYQFDLMVVQLVDNISGQNTGSGYIEDLRDAISTQFDNNFTLAGTAPLGVAAVFSQKFQTEEKGKKFVTFYLTLRATTLANLTYSS